MAHIRKNIVVAITGASGSIYAKSLIEYLSKIINHDEYKLSLIFSETGRSVALHEIGIDFTENTGIELFENDNFYAPFASGSSVAEALIIVPCTMGTMGRIAHGTSDNLICRTADVVLKEKKKLVLVIRETPFNLIHIKNMEIISLAGGIIMPASPSFYLNPQSIDELVLSITHRIVDQIGISHNIKRWGRKEQK